MRAGARGRANDVAEIYCLELVHPVEKGAIHLFFLAAFGAAFGYALQFSLMASFYRKMDTLMAIAYRGLSLGLSLLPLLLWVPQEQFGRIGALWFLLPPLFLLTAAGDWTIANTVRYLPIGIATALANGLIAIVAGLIGYFFFHEVLQVQQMVVMGLIIAAVFLLGFLRSSGTLPREYNVRLGLLNAGLTGLFLAGGYGLVGGLSRTLHPFLVGYIWELGTGITALCFVWLRARAFKVGWSSLSAKEFIKLLVASSPTLIGTGLYAFSMTMGPLGLATAIISTQMVFTTLLSRLLYHEKLSLAQWILLLFICGLVIALRQVSG